jgi:6-phosphogluconolactonase
MQIYRPQVLFFETNTLLFNHATIYISDIILDYTGNEGNVKLALSGGNTPTQLYKNLALNPIIPWNMVELYQVDERYVVHDDSQSNQRLIVDSFGESTINLMKSINFFDTTLQLEQTVEQYNEILDSLDGELFDITVLGIGEDGHIASLFPKGQYLSHMENKSISTKAPKNYEVEQRLSITVESILSSETIIVLLVGQSKSAIIKELLEGVKSASEFPAKFLLSHPNVHIFQSLEEMV